MAFRLEASGKLGFHPGLEQLLRVPTGYLLSQVLKIFRGSDVVAMDMVYSNKLVGKALARCVACWRWAESPVSHEKPQLRHRSAKVKAVRRFLRFVATVFILTALMYAVWGLSVFLLPEGVFRPYFSRLFAARVGEFTFTRIFLANFLVPFLGTQFMNLFRVGRTSGGLYVLPMFWIIYGVLLGTNSFVFAEQKVPISISVLWTRTGFTELLAYAAGYEASRGWALWDQEGLWRVRRIADRKWKPSLSDWAYWGVGLLLLVVAVAREVQG